MKIFDRIQIENYRNIRSVSLDNLRDFNILIGPNNSGKTGILSGIETLCTSMRLGASTCADCKSKDPQG